MPRRPARPGKYRPNRVKFLRDREGLSDQALADRLGWPVSKIAKIENRQQDLKLNDIYALAEALQVHRIEIFEELPYGPRVRDAAERISGVSEATQDTIFRLLDVLIPEPPPEPPPPAAPDPPPAAPRRAPRRKSKTASPE